MSVFEEFEAQFAAELASLWQAVRDKKREIWSLLKAQIESENDFETFKTTCEAHFRPLNMQVAQLKDQKVRLTHRLEAVDSPYGEIVDSAEDAGRSGSSRHEEDEYGPIRLGASDDLGHASAYGEEPTLPSAKKHQHTPGAKKLSDMLHKLYQARTQGQQTAFRNERVQRINDLLGKESLDEVTLIMKVPFEAEDEIIWQTPPDYAHAERHERPHPLGKVDQDAHLYYRYRMLDALLEKALPLARNMAQAEPDPLYEDFLKCQQQDMPAKTYVLGMDAHLKAQIARLEAETAELQRRLDSRT